MSFSCGGPDHARVSRRDFLHVGLVGGLGLTLPEFLTRRAYAQETQPHAVAQAVIHIFLPGGLAAQESFDPKPNAPIEYRGPLGVIPTALTGVVLSENLVETANITDKICLVRGLWHGEAAHERGTHNMYTGYRPSPALLYPSIGSVVSHELGMRGELPPYICVPSLPNEFAGSGFLSTRFGPFSLGADPADKGFVVRDLSLPKDVDAARFDRRRKMLDAVNQHFHALETSDALSAMDEFYSKAYTMLSSDKARAAFNLAAEPDALRDRYGRHAAGQRMLLCRRLVEAGTRFVSMTFGGWDHHAKIAEGVRGQLREFDQAFAALVSDLAERGLLETTMVLVTTEFGRTPKINKDGGRDHWPRVFSIVMAGGGVRGGIVHGSSDATGGAPDRDPLTVEDLAATIYHQLGIDPEKRLIAPGDRPVVLAKNGVVVDQLLAKKA